MLIHQPHDLACVHSGAAAQSDDHVRLESAELFYAASRALKSRIGCHLVEAGIGNAHLVQLIRDRLGMTVAVEETIGYNKGFFLLIIGFQFVQRHRQAAFFEVYFLRCAEPEHIFSPFCHGLDIDQMLYVDIFGYGIASVGAAAQGQGGSQLEVVKVADAALGGRSIYQDTAGLHAGRMLCHFFGLGRMDIEGGGMAVAAVLDELLGHIQGCLEILCLIQCQYRGQLLMGEGLTDIHRCHFSDQDFCLLRHLKACQSRDDSRGLTYDFRIDRPCLCQNNAAHLIQFFFVQNMAAALYEFCAYLIINIRQSGYGLLGRADHTVVKGL